MITSSLFDIEKSIDSSILRKIFLSDWKFLIFIKRFHFAVFSNLDSSNDCSFFTSQCFSIAFRVACCRSTWNRSTDYRVKIIMEQVAAGSPWTPVSQLFVSTKNRRKKKKRSHALFHTQSSSSVYDFRCYGFHASAIFRPFSPMINIYERHVITLVHSLTRSFIHELLYGRTWETVKYKVNIF